MHTQFLLRTGFVAAVALSLLASSIPSSFAASSRGGGGTSGGSSSSGGGSPGGGDGGGKGGNPDRVVPDLVTAVGGDECRGSLAQCGGRPRPRPRPITVQAPSSETLTNCNQYYWRHVMLSDGTIIEDHSVAPRKYCQVIHYVD